jgi:hypothetical protein
LSVQQLDERVAPASPGPTSTAAVGTSADPATPPSTSDTAAGDRAATRSGSANAHKADFALRQRAVDMRWFPSESVPYRGDAPIAARVDLLPAEPALGELSVVVDAVSGDAAARPRNALLTTTGGPGPGVDTSTAAGLADASTVGPGQPGGVVWATASTGARSEASASTGADGSLVRLREQVPGAEAFWVRQVHGGGGRRPTDGGLAPVARDLEYVRRDFDGPGSRSVEVATDRWLPRSDPFEFVGPRTIRRRKDSGERTHVRYQLTDDGTRWRFRIRLRLVAGPGVRPADLDQIRETARTGLAEILQRSDLALPGVQRAVEIGVEFVDSDEHAAIRVDAKASSAVMNQATWLVGSSPGSIVHEILHLLGVVHEVHHDPADAVGEPGDVTAAVPAQDRPLVLSEQAKQQIVDVAVPFLAPDGAVGRRAASPADPVAADAFDALPRVGSGGSPDPAPEIPQATAPPVGAAQTAVPQVGATTSSVPDPAPTDRYGAQPQEADAEAPAAVPTATAPTATVSAETAPTATVPAETVPTATVPAETVSEARGEPMLGAPDLTSVVLPPEHETETRDRLRGWIAGMKSHRVLATLPVGPAPVTRAAVDSQLAQFEDELTRADRDGLRVLDGQVRDLTLKLFWWRQLLAEARPVGGSGWPTAPQDRDERYHATVQRAFQVRSQLAARWQAPLDPEHDQRPARTATARALDAAVAWLEGSLLASEGDRPLPRSADGWWSEDGEVTAAYERLDRLIESTEAQLTRPAPPWEPAPHGDDWQPAQRFAPGRHLTPDDGTRPALGTEIVMAVSEEMRRSIVDAAIRLLPTVIRGDAETRRELEAALAGDAVLADDGADLLSDGILVEVRGHAVRLGAWLTGGTQASDVFEARPKAVRNLRRRLGRDLSHSYFADANLNLSWALDLNGPDARIPVADSTYAGLLTALLGEHEESFGDITVNQTEHTVKGSSYRSLLFDFAARPWAQVRYPDGAVRTTVDNLGEVPKAIVLLASREATVQLSGSQPQAVVHADPAEDYRNVDGPWTRPPIPFNSTIEAIPGASTIRQRAEQYLLGDARSAADAGSLTYRKLASALRPGMLRSGLHEALLDRHGYRIDFGDIDGRGAASIGVHVELGAPTPVTLWDPLTWADMSRLRRTTLGHEQVSADAVDIPPGLLLAATSMVFGWGSVEPYLFAWPTLDTLVTRAGVGIDVTESSGLRMTGIPQSVLRFPATVHFSRSDQGDARSQAFDLPGGVLVRMAREDARRWVELPPLPSDVSADEAPRLRLPKTNYLPPLIQISDVAFKPESAGSGPAAQRAPAAEHGPPAPAADTATPASAEPARTVDLVEHVLALLRQHFPGTVPHEDGSATRFTGGLARSLADARQASENLETVTRHLRTANLPNLAMQMATADGFSFRLARKDISARLGDDVLVRVRAPLFREGSGGQVEVWQADGRWVPQAEMDAFLSTNEDLTHASVRIFGFWLGVEPLVSLSNPRVGALHGIEPRPLIRGRLVRTSTNVSGFDVSGLRGVSVDEAVEFPAAVAFRVTVESAPPLLRVDLPGVRDDDAEVIPGTFLEAPPATDEERGTAFPPDPSEAPPALPRVINGPWLTARYTMLVPAELAEQQLDDGTWVPRTVARLIAAGQLPRETRRLTGAGGRPLELRPDRANPLPRRVLVMTGANGLPKAALEALNELRPITLTPAQRVELDSALAAKVRQAHSLLGGAREVWSGRVGMLHTATVKLRYVPTELVTRGVAEGYGTFTDFGGASVVGLGTERQRGALLGLRLRFPIDAGGTADVPAETDRVAQNLVNYQPQAAVRRDVAAGTETEHSGFTSRGAIQIGRTVLADIRGHFEVTAELKQRFTGTREATRQVRRVDTEGLAAMSELTGTQLRLMPEGMEVELDSTVTYVLPDQVRRSQGLGGWIDEAPDISEFIHEVVASVRSRFGESLAGPLEEELDKITDPDVTASTLDLFFGGFRQTVAASRFQRVGVPLIEATIPLVPGEATVTVTINAEYARDQFHGVSPTQHYLGSSDAAERVDRLRDVRSRRLAVDPVRGWLRRFPNRGVLNSEWYQFNLTGFGQTNRETSVGTGAERGHGLTLDTGAGGRGAAVFDVFLTLSASVTVVTTPVAMLDAVSLGFAQTNTTWLVPKHALREPVTVMYDPNLLESMVNRSAPDPPVTQPGPPDHRLDGRDGMPDVPDRPILNLAAPPVQWGPITRGDTQRPLWDVVRRGRAIDPALLEDAVVTNLPDLDLVRDQAYRFGAHPTVGPGGSPVDWISSLWRSRVLNGPANASWFSSQLLHEDFIYAIVNRPFLIPRVRTVLTSGIAQPLRLPGRFYQTEANLELVADVVEIRRGRGTDDGQNRRTRQETSVITASTDVVAGYSMSPWANWDWPVRGYRHFRPDRNNAVGGLLGVDYIQTDGDRASLRSRTGSGGAFKTTGRSFTELHLLVRWSVGLSIPGEATRIYSTDATPRRVTLLVPNEVVAEILHSPVVSSSALADVSEQGRRVALDEAVGGDPADARVITTWLRQPNWEASQRFFEQHQAELTTPASRAYLRGISPQSTDAGARTRQLDRVDVHDRLLQLALAGDASLGFRYLNSPTLGRGINEVFAALLGLALGGQRAAWDAFREVVAADHARQANERQASAMLDAVTAMFDGDFAAAERIVEDVRGRMSGQDRLDWINILANMTDLYRFGDQSTTLRRLLAVEHLGNVPQPAGSWAVPASAYE